MEILFISLLVGVGLVLAGFGFFVMKKFYLHSAEISSLIGEKSMKLSFFIQRVSKLPLKEDKASGGCHGFLREDFRVNSKKSGRNHAEA